MTTTTLKTRLCTNGRAAVLVSKMCCFINSDKARPKQGTGTMVDEYI